jgi:serine-type D-Ala-D-Ala carboxypeptidase (penicillin-binding protein 5/6)
MKTQYRMLFLLVILIISGVVCTPANTEDLLSIKATAAILMNSENGDVLYARNFNRSMAPASTTKIMTAIIAIEKGDLERKVVISATAAVIPGSSMYLRKGEVITLRNLLYGLLLSSGNDAATAIAETIAGTEKKFAVMMNEKARELGMLSTSFKNASGLPAVGHYTTAYDLALLARYALKNPVFSEIVKTKTASIPASRSSRTSSLTNHNKLLWQYPYTTGIKTGYTRKAGKCLVASATQNEVTLISVVLKSDIMYNDSITLFDYGFNNIKMNEQTTNEVSTTIEAITPTPGSHESPSNAVSGQ